MRSVKDGTRYFAFDLPTRLRVIDPEATKQLLAVDLREFALSIETKLIDFYGDVCYYSDAHGNLYIMDFDIQA